MGRKLTAMDEADPKYTKVRVSDGYRWARGIRGRIDGIQAKVIFDVESDPRYRRNKIEERVKMANNTIEFMNIKYGKDKGKIQLAVIDVDYYERVLEEFARNGSITSAICYMFMSKWADQKTPEYLYLAEEKAMAHEDPVKLVNILSWIHQSKKAIEENRHLKTHYEQKRKEKREKAVGLTLTDPLSKKVLEAGNKNG